MDKSVRDITMDSKRTEKLVSALYLLTSFFEDREPIKWRLRELGNRLISNHNGNTVLEIISLLTVAKNAGLISDTNFDIIHKEFSKSTPQIRSISELFIQEEVREEKQIPEKVVEKPEPRTFYLGSSIQPKPIVREIKDRPVRESGSMEVKKNSRQTTIINLLKRKKEIMIKDVSPLIPGVSEKTIQRELLSMVSEGILRKIGEKRWSKYTLAD